MRHFLIIQRILGLLLMIFSGTMLPPILVSLWYDDGAMLPFILGFLLTLMVGLICWFPVRNFQQELRLRDGFLVVVILWIILSLSGCLPFMLTDDPHMPFVDALFESISGLTSTGATVIIGIDILPKSILYYRQQLQWLGGMGIIVLAVAVLPVLGIGGMQLYRAETPGPMKDSKLVPRITETAKALWYIYLTLTIACFLAYWVAGMNAFDALGHSFSTVSIGGLSTHDQSMGYFDSTLIEMVAVVFMLLSGINFSLHFTAWQNKNVRYYFDDSEFKFYLGLLSFVALIVSVTLYLTDTYIEADNAFFKGLFQAVSIGTTTGFTTAEYHNWPGFISILLLMTSFVGGCAGSTGGGIKVIRFLLLIKQGMREINRLIHPNAQIIIRVGQQILNNRVIDAVWGFFALYVASFALMYLAIAATDLDLITAFSSVVACMNNLGPGLGMAGVNYAGLNDIAKYILCFAMLLGRLEIFTLLVLFTPAFWKR